MKLLIIACLLAVASARPSEEQLGTERCTWGPAYWCKNYKHATECNAIEHCKEHVWKSNDLCSECKSTVGEIHDFAKNNGTEVLAYMKELCALVGEFAEECNMLVDLYGKTILSTVLNLTADSDKLCQELGLCSKSKQEIQHTLFKVFIAQLKTNPHMIHLKSVKADYCEDCKLVFAEIKDLLEDKAIQGDVVGLLEKLCAEFGSYASECKSLVDQYGPMIFEELASLDDPDAICSELGLCNSTKKVLAAHRLTPAKLPKLFFPMAPGPLLIDATELEKAKKIKSPKVSVECAVCEFAMKELDGILGDNATKEEIQEALDEVCSILPSTIRSECQDLINEYAPMIIKLLLEEVQPDQICTELGLCSGAKKLVRVALHKDFKTNDDTCELCKLVVGYLENILKSNATEDEIKKALEEICNMLPGELKTECDAIIQEYGDLLIKLILGELSPQEVCQELTLCQSGGNGFLKYKCFLGESYWCANYRNALKCQATDHCNYLKFLKFFKSTKFQETRVVKDSKFCLECKNDVNYLGNLFPKNTSKQQILNGLKAFCSRFEPSLVKDCDDIIERYGDIIVKLLQGKVDPETFCEKLHLCKASKKAWLNMKCYLGKSYWCMSYQNALDCQALEHCQFAI